MHLHPGSRSTKVAVQKRFYATRDSNHRALCWLNNASIESTSAASGSTIFASTPSDSIGPATQTSPSQSASPHDSPAPPSAIDPSPMGHEAGQITDLALDDDVATFHRNAAAWTGVTFDVNRAANHGGAGGHARIAVDGDVAARHAFADAPARRCVLCARWRRC